jgi:predicted RNase H-like HicB family nuclease
MNPSKKQLMEEALIEWSEEDNCFTAYCPSWDIAIGTGMSKDSAMEMLSEMLDDCLEDLAQDKVAELSKPKPVGRPALGRETFNTKLRPDVKEFIKKTAKANKISAGELIERVITLQFENVPNPQRRKSDALYIINTSELIDYPQRERLQDGSSIGYIIHASDSELHIAPKRPRTSSTPKPKNAKS